MEKPQNFAPECPATNLPNYPLSDALSLQSKRTLSASPAKPKPLTDIPPEPSKSAPLRSAADRARARGQSFGSGFSALNGAQIERAENMGDAIRLGMANAARADDRDAFCAQDADSLRELGFHGRDPDDF